MTTPSRRQFLAEVGGATALPLAFALTSAAKPAVKRIKIGQIGVGHGHASKVDVYRNSEHFELVGIVEPNAELRKRAQAQAPFKDLTWMTQEQLLNVSGLKAVLVETPVRDLLATAKKCVDAGMHIHLDKPAGESLPHLRRLFEAAGKQKLLVQMGYMYRFSPAIVLLREFLKNGWLGDPFEVHAVMSKVLDAPARSELAEYRGGVMFELGCHLIDLVVSILGKPAAIAAHNQHVSRIDDKLLDNMLAVFTYPKATASVKSSAQEVEGFERRHLVVCGTEGTIHIQPLDNPSARIALSMTRGEYKKGYQDVRFPKFTRYVADAIDMARIIREEKASDFPPEHDLAVQETVLKSCGLPLE